MISSSITSFFADFFTCMGGCFGCCTKPTPIIAVDEPANGLRIRGHVVKKSAISDDFWSTSTCDLDNSTIQSQRSMSSLTTLNQILFRGNGTGNTGSDPEFLNHGLLRWNEIRHNWVGTGITENHNHKKREWKLNWNATYESLLGSRQRFPEPIPLSEMVEFLVDSWEHEGMYE